jgi:hypothetical protein
MADASPEWRSCLRVEPQQRFLDLCFVRWHGWACTNGSSITNVWSTPS